MIEKNINNHEVTIHVSGLNLGQIIIEGLKKLGYIDEKLQKEYPHARVTIHDGNPALPKGIINDEIKYPIMSVWGRKIEHLGQNPASLLKEDVWK